MPISIELQKRAQNTCELCSSKDPLDAFTVAPYSDGLVDHQVATCPVCLDQLTNPESIDPNHWRCLNDSMWSEIPAVQVTAYRMLGKLSVDWASDLRNMMYLDEDTQRWADQDTESASAVVHKDSNGHILSAGDSVVLIKDLKVKGANFIAKRGTAVRRISLVPDNPEHIEGRVEDQYIVILTQYVKKTN